MSPPSKRRVLARRLAYGCALAGLGVFVWLAVQVYASKKDPENYRAWDGPLAWIIGPPAAELEEAARGRLAAALELLNDTSRGPAERLRLYRAELERAEKLLIRRLQARACGQRL